MNDGESLAISDAHVLYQRKTCKYITNLCITLGEIQTKTRHHQPNKFQTNLNNVYMFFVECKSLIMEDRPNQQRKRKQEKKNQKNRNVEEEQRKKGNFVIIVRIEEGVASTLGQHPL